MAENTRVPLNRTERIIAFAAASVLGLTIVSLIALFIGRASNADFRTAGVWQVVATLPGIGLPLTLLAVIAFIIVTFVRRARLTRDAGQ